MGAPQIKSLLLEHGLSPKKALGQNFLIDDSMVRRLVDAAGVGEGDLVLEVGPGTGVLTTVLLERGCRVVASELDAGLARLLRDTLGQAYPARFTLVEGDCLAGKREINPAVIAALGSDPFTLVANLPYGCATPLMLSLMADHPSCLGQHVTIQKEVVDRLLAEPGSKAYGTISVAAALSGERSRVAVLPPGCFWPQPKVTSAMISLKPVSPPADLRRIADLCTTLFASRRKQIGGVVRRLGEVDLPAGISPMDRVEDLSPDAIAGLCRVLADR